MKKILLLTTLFTSLFSFGQWNYYQYFDGADTVVGQSLFIQLEDSVDNIWQIGKPQKIIFNEASTFPNALVTDTINSIPDSNYSAFLFGIPKSIIDESGVLAVQWNQKLDFEYYKEGGFIEFSVDTGSTWKNIFTTPEVYNTYGYSSSNEYYTSGDQGFTGRDTTWRNVWFCIWTYDLVPYPDSIIMRFRIETDTLEYGSEGWMIDNIIAEPTFFHTLAEKTRDKAFTLYPTLVQDGEIRLKYNGDFQEKSNFVWIYSVSGTRVYENLNYISNEPIKVNELAPGKYFVRIKTGSQNEVHELVIQP